MTATKPARKPARPHFSSGPCAKPPGYSPDKLATQSLGRSHRARIGKARLQYCIDLMRELNQSEGTTFIFSTHDPKIMTHADRLVQIKDGRVVEPAA